LFRSDGLSAYLSDVRVQYVASRETPGLPIQVDVTLKKPGFAPAIVHVKVTRGVSSTFTSGSNINARSVDGVVLAGETCASESLPRRADWWVDTQPNRTPSPTRRVATVEREYMLGRHRLRCEFDAGG
jgi:hypothetical protein